MFKKVILFFLMGFASLQANSLNKCDNTAVVSNLKEKIPSEILKNLYELSGLKAQGIDYEDYAKGFKEMVKHYGKVNYTDIIEINSISNFDLNFDSCMATINATLKGEQRKGLWSVVYKVSNINQVEITDITYINGDFQ
ncbi:TPA: hypothetical protein SB731_001440 [Campylobacter jejuni]|uniref:hypothetical protein n=1 Tax=Campylobacter jejuni TaxID=197 RepID=UPI000F8045A0|nr:hypothetical protein [Campylobacter jejuni]EAJ7870657.1 hypothetical protein [Campylobacter jejuni]EAK1650620.1 hypothetical protein [Campylobacter jejuni]EAL2050874.1 hypothetical protein [Campylobacter jejuni]EAM0959514.1 hypothetical protein [Campylobacter jejuni]ECL0430401.1 hypothetical protein [Campylobacter jejuni]